MNFLNLLMGSLGSDASVSSLSKKTGVDSSMLMKLLPLAIPVLLKALTNNASAKDGGQSLLTALGQHTSTRSIPDQIADVDEEDGQKIVAHILGDKSENVVSALSRETGMESAQVTRSLGALAPALMSLLSSSANSVHSSGVNLADGIDLTDVMGLFGGMAQPQQSSGVSPSSGPAAFSAPFWAAVSPSSSPAAFSAPSWAAASPSSPMRTTRSPGSWVPCSAADRARSWMTEHSFCPCSAA